MDTFLDFLTLAAVTARSHVRELIVCLAMAMVFAGGIHLLHSFEDEQKAQAAASDELTKPLASNTPVTAASTAPQEWCSPNNWPADCH